jgi:hypothetical protein
MSSVDAQIEELKRTLDATEDELAKRGEISVESWMLIKSYIYHAIALNGLGSTKGLEESASSLPAGESASS